MIRLSVLLQGTSPVALVAAGHAGFSEAGTDIVCAAVSTLLQNLAVGAEDVVKIKGVEVVSKSQEGYFSITWPREELLRVPCWNVLIQTTLRSLTIIESQYGDFLRISEVHDYHESI